MKSLLKNTALIIIGIFIGGTGMAYLSEKASDMHVEIIKGLYENSEETAAKKAIKNKEYFLAVHHFKNLSDCYSVPSIEAFTLGKDTWGLMFPFQAVTLRKIDKISDPEGIGASRISGLYRGMLAYSLEKYGKNDVAQKEWQISTKLLGKNNISETKKNIERILER